LAFAPVRPVEAAEPAPHMFFYIALIAWLGGVVVSFANGNRRLPSVVLLLGFALVVLTFAGKAGYFGLAGIAFLAAIIWVANKADLT
jgi:hypothetical protein